MGSFCGGSAFNVVPASPAFSTVAGVIGGFVFAGMIMMLAERRSATGFAQVPTLMQFFAGVVSLGFSAYMFGLLAGEATEACRRTWTIVATASGMLAVGVVAAIGGVVLLVYAYLPGAVDDRIKAQLLMLRQLLRLSYVLISVVAAALLVVRNSEATWVWLGKDLSALLPAFVVGVLMIGFAAIAARLLLRGPTLAPPSEATDPHCNQLRIGAITTVLYALAAAVTVGASLSLFNGDWNEASPMWAALPVASGTLTPLLAIFYFVRGVLGLVDSWPEPGTASETPGAPLTRR